MANTTWLDPWLKLREKTAVRNDLTTVADRYSKMRRLALAQYNDLRERPKTRQATLDGLLGIIKFCDDLGAPLWQRLEMMEAEIHEETERLENEQC